MSLVKNWPGQGFSETLFKSAEDFLIIQRGLQKAAWGIGRYKSNLHGLTAYPDGKREVLRVDGLLADIDKTLLDVGRAAEKKHALKAPVREIDDFIIVSGRMGQHIPKKIVAD